MCYLPLNTRYAVQLDNQILSSHWYRMSEETKGESFPAIWGRDYQYTITRLAAVSKTDNRAADKRIAGDLSSVAFIDYDKMSRLLHMRNPYPVPDVSREGIWVRRPVLGDKVSPGDKDWGVKLQAHERLFAHHTLNSIRKDKRLMRSKVPNDSLDLALTTVYTHSKDTLVPKVYVFMQPETIGKETWRKLRNEVKIPPKQPELTQEEEDILRFIRGEQSCLLSLKNKSLCDRGPVAERRIHPSSVKLNIDGPHAVQSNPGYSRKIDGTFFSI